MLVPYKLLKPDRIKPLVDKEVCHSDEGNGEFMVVPEQGNGDMQVVHSDADRRDHLKKVLNIPEANLS